MEFIAPIVDKILAVLEARTPALLGARAPFAAYGKQFTGIVPNFPAVYVMPVRTEFDSEATGASHQAHQVQIKCAVEGSEPDAIVVEAVAYMTAIHEALAASWPADWAGVLSDGQVEALLVRGHDYGPLFERGNVLARFPELDLVVMAVEDWAGLEGV